MTIDAHRHILPGKSNVDELLLQMQRDSVSRCVVFGFHGLQVFSEKNRQDAEILAVAKAHPDKLIPFFCDFDFYDGDAPGYVDSAVRKGFKGLGEVLLGHGPIMRSAFPHARLSDPEPLRIFQLCGEKGLPVLFHADPMFFEDALRMLRQSPSTVFVWAHMGYDFTGEYGGSANHPDTLQRWLDSNDNLYFDLSHWKISPVYLNEPCWKDLLEDRCDRFIFGADMTEDYLIQSAWMPAYKMILDSLSTKAKRHICHGNIMHLVTS